MDSDEYLTDEGKRRKDDTEYLFKKSRKTHRTPPTDGINEQIKEMMRLMRNLASDIKEIKKEQQDNSEETRVLQEEIRKLRNEQEDFKKNVLFMLFGSFIYNYKRPKEHK